eukprot:TRINITY_DN7529_c0_g4_i2.p1 TRINITY_DN7529_c0_g4~~TRINITY_DN7529_c0_g4_i2.p1  ORF type:complete len:191 (-),score=64.90 TRINITY_DN7529_c0_g4_i2:61-633(-)
MCIRDRRNVESILHMNSVETPKVNINFEIQKSGRNLSNGEKQIINFLRILLRDSSIICLDEATSNMDPQTDEELHDALFDFASDKTMIVITHRLEKIHMYDKVAVLDRGEVVEFGNYRELSQKENGFFSKKNRNTGEKEINEQITTTTKKQRDNIRCLYIVPQVFVDGLAAIQIVKHISLRMVRLSLIHI